MGAVCSGGATKKSVKAGGKTTGFSGKLKSTKSFSKQKENSRPYSYRDQSDYGNDQFPLSISRELKPTPIKTRINKVPQKSSFIGRAGVVGLERAVEVLDTLGSSMTNLNAKSGFVTGIASRGNKLSILSFEVANTIAKGANLLQSLSKENVQFLRKEILHSEGVRQLVSADMNELLSIAAADKRNEWDLFSHEVIRFGNLCKDPQWHNLCRYFSKIDSEFSDSRQPRADAEATMQELATLAQHTSELYHELHALDRFEQDFQRKREEVDDLHRPRRGDSLMILQSELKQQRKLVRSLKKKSLWSKNLEEIMEKLVDIVIYIHQAITEAFGNNGLAPVSKQPSKSRERLGIAGLALHYANIINQIDNIASRPTSLPPNMRDTLYQGLPINVKSALRSQLQTLDVKEELSVSQVKAEMEKTLRWLVPLATNTTKAHQGFGWVGEWANTGNEFGKNATVNNNLTRLQTLYHADKQKMDKLILGLVAWLHHLVSLVRKRDYEFKPFPLRSPTHKGPGFHSEMQRSLSLNYYTKANKIKLTQAERNLLDKVTGEKMIPGISKSQEFPLMGKRGIKTCTLSKSAGNSPTRELSARQTRKHSRSNILDVMDGLDEEF